MNVSSMPIKSYAFSNDKESLFQSILSQGSNMAGYRKKKKERKNLIQRGT